MKLVKFYLLIFSIFLTNSALAQFICQNGVRTIVNELDFEINLETNEIVFDLTCDPCIFEDGGSNCECMDNCKDEAYEDCYSDCRNEPYAIDEYYCKLDCDSYYGYDDWEDYQSCFKNCGETVGRTRQVDQFAYAFNLWWTHSIFESQNGAPDESIVTNIQDGPVREIVHSSTEDFEDKSISYCYQYEVFVEYDDGTCCRFVGAACFQKG